MPYKIVKLPPPLATFADRKKHQGDPEAHQKMAIYHFLIEGDGGPYRLAPLQPSEHEGDEEEPYH
jgi:hypothetical protein